LEPVEKNENKNNKQPQNPPPAVFHSTGSNWRWVLGFFDVMKTKTTKQNEEYGICQADRKSPRKKAHKTTETPSVNAEYKPYWEKLRDPRWQRKRTEIMQRDNYTCRYCQSTENTLNVHHRVYRKGKSPWEYEDDVFVTLCESCHETAEVYKNYVLMRLARGQLNDKKIAALVNTLAGAQGEDEFPIESVDSLASCIGKFYLLKENPNASRCDIHAEFEHHMKVCIESMYRLLFSIRTKFPS
jgi:5-methylcytosine-specific restriction endonuclease McrA